MSVPVYLKAKPIKTFYDPGNPRKIHPELRKFRNIVAKIAVLDFSEKELKDHYEKNFYEAQITYVKVGREYVAFFIAAFSKVIDINGHAIYNGSGFPGIKYKYRNREMKTEKRVDFQEIMTKLIFSYINHYYTKILPSGFVKSANTALIFQTINGFLLENKSYSKKLETIINYMIDNINFKQKDSLVIDATAENPIMYATLMGMNLSFEGNDPRPSKSDLAMIDRWDTEKLLLESYKKSLGPEHPCLISPSFVVNIPALEWRQFFTKVGKGTGIRNSYLKYFLWQNFSFPDKAFLFSFKVNLKNIFKVIPLLYK